MWVRLLPLELTKHFIMNNEEKLGLIEYVNDLDLDQENQLIITLVEMLIEQEEVSCYLDEDTGEFNLYDAHTGEPLV